MTTVTATSQRIEGVYDFKVSLTCGTYIKCNAFSVSNASRDISLVTFICHFLRRIVYVSSIYIYTYICIYIYDNYSIMCVPPRYG